MKQTYEQTDEESLNTESIFTDKDENGYAIQVCRDSIKQSGGEESLPKKKSDVIEKILEEPENFLLHKVTSVQTKQPDSGDTEVPPDKIVQFMVKNGVSDTKK